MKSFRNEYMLKSLIIPSPCKRTSKLWCLIARISMAINKVSNWQNISDQLLTKEKYGYIV